MQIVPTISGHTIMTLRQAISAAATKLAEDEHLRSTSARDAELLLLHHLGINRTQLFANPDRELTQEEDSSYWRSISRRATQEPVQYIIGQQEFYGLNFFVSPAVLIPRPETEHLVEAVLEILPRDGFFQILDVGTGSGILAVTLALHLPHAEFTAVDISAEALAVARRNAEAHEVSHRIKFIESDLLAAVDTGPFDAVVSNPPYIPVSDRAALAPQVRDYEPATALFGGLEGLDLYRRLIPEADLSLKPNGLLALEIGYDQQAALTNLLRDWRNVSFIDDLQQIPRVVLAKKAAT
jgi:release factor glutamine methyltransferase